jgi:antitoxin MazE
MYLLGERYELEGYMRLQLAKWGNSLAVRLPAECVRAAGLRQGDSIDAEITPAGKITLTPAKIFDKPAFLQRLRKLRREMPITEPVVEQMRQENRY